MSCEEVREKYTKMVKERRCTIPQMAAAMGVWLEANGKPPEKPENGSEWWQGGGERVDVADIIFENFGGHEVKESIENPFKDKKIDTQEQEA